MNDSILTYWQVNDGAITGMIALIIAYIWYHGGIMRFWGVYLTMVVGLMVLCFNSPLAVLSNLYLFSAHMVTHVVLLLITGPLMVICLHKKTIEESSRVYRMSKLLTQRPFLGWLAGVGIMWFWHIPAIFNFCMSRMHGSDHASDLTQLAESFSLLIAGMLFSWPILSPVKSFRLSALSGIVYLFTACIGCSLLGLMITFAPAGTYQHFLSAADVYQLNHLILYQWGITQSMDQQIAGLIMWVPCCLIYVVYALYLLVRWYKEKEDGHGFVLRNY